MLIAALFFMLIINSYSADSQLDPLFPGDGSKKSLEQLKDEAENTRVFGTIFTGYFPPLPIPYHKIEPVELSLGWILRRLHTFVPQANFVPGQDFDTLSFERMAGKIGNMLKEIKQNLKNFPPSKSLSSQLDFATRVFIFMESVQDELKTYKIESTCEYLVRAIIQINIRLLTFYDSQGIPYSIDKEYAGEIWLYMEYVKDWKSLFQILPNIPLGKSLMFESQYTQAQRTLTDLESRIPLEIKDVRGFQISRSFFSDK